MPGDVLTKILNDPSFQARRAKRDAERAANPSASRRMSAEDVEAAVREAQAAGRLADVDLADATFVARVYAKWNASGKKKTEAKQD